MSKEQHINVHVWTITVSDDYLEAWSAPILGATRQQAHDGMLWYLIEYLSEIYEHTREAEEQIDWRAFTDVKELIETAKKDDWDMELDVSVHTINASDVEYAEAGA